MQLISVTIQPYLVPFLFQELEGESKATYGQKRVKLAKVTNRSPLGKLLHLFKTRAVERNPPQSLMGFGVFLSLDQEDADNTKAIINERHTENRHKELQFLPEDVMLLNDHLESIFRISFVSFVKGYVKTSEDVDFINQAIHEYMLLHKLYETHLDPETLRRFYYNAIQKEHELYRLQVPVSSQLKSFANSNCG